VGVPIRDVGGIDIIDIQLGKSRKSLPVNAPHNAYNTGRNDVLYVLRSMGDHEIDRIDLTKMEYTDKIPVGGIPRPYAVTKNEKTLYVALSGLSRLRDCEHCGQKKRSRAWTCHRRLRRIARSSHIRRRMDWPFLPMKKNSGSPAFPTAGSTCMTSPRKKLSKEISTGGVPELDRIFTRRQVCDREQLRKQRTRQSSTQVRKKVVATVKTGEGPKRLLAMVVPGS